MNKKFALTGIAGYIAPRHLQAITDTGNTLVAALDPHDAVGILDRYFPDCDFFTEPERFDRHLDKLHRSGQGVDYMTICSPNYLHDAHIRMALRNGANAICEKPLVLNPHNLDLLKQLETETGKKIYNVLQLRHHPRMIALKEKFSHTGKVHQVELQYITSRGKWYQYSWKGNEERSGGILSNIGIHFFDVLIWIFGAVQRFDVIAESNLTYRGNLYLQNADVKWLLSIDKSLLPSSAKGGGTYRVISIDGENASFSDGFGSLHTAVYQNIMHDDGFGIEDARPSIELVYNLRKMI